VAHLILLQEDPDTQLDPTLFAALIFDHFHTRLLVHIDTPKKDIMEQFFAPAPFDEDVFTVEFAQSVSPLSQDLNSLMTIIFVDSWTAQLSAYKKQAADRAVAKQVREYLDGTATVQAADLMDAEPTANPALLKEIIKKQVDQETRQLHTKINRLKQAQACSPKTSTSTA